MNEYLSSVPGAPASVGPYSVAVKSQGLVFCSGQVGIDPASGKLVEGGAVKQADQILKNLAAVLEAQSLGFGDVVMTTIFLTDMNDWRAVNEVYAAAMNSQRLPARQTVAVAALPLGAAVEISIVAACRE